MAPHNNGTAQHACAVIEIVYPRIFIRRMRLGPGTETEGDSRDLPLLEEREHRSALVPFYLRPYAAA
jgi:hypothetical protein